MDTVAGLRVRVRQRRGMVMRNGYYSAVWLALGALAVVAAAASCGADAEETGAPPVAVGGGTGVGGSAGAGGGVGGHAGAGGGECVPEEELCDGLDNDCDDEVDEDCPCIQGEVQECYSGDPGLVGIGECAMGEQACDEHGLWGLCENEVLPIAEVCDGLDNDCNGADDDGFGTTTCGLGICQVTVEACVNGQPVPCIPGDPEPPEDCEGTDDDCDGVVDEDCICILGDPPNPCYTGSPQTQNVGECHDGEQDCQPNGTWGPPRL